MYTCTHAPAGYSGRGGPTPPKAKTQLHMLAPPGLSQACAFPPCTLQTDSFFSGSSGTPHHVAQGEDWVPAVGTVEVVRMVWVVLENQGLLVNDGVALLADVLPQASGFLSIVTGATQVSKQDKMEIQSLSSFFFFF